VKPTSKVKSITSNTVTSGRTRGIAFYSGKSKAVISKNVIKKCKGNAIYIDAKTKKYKIVVKSNKIAGKGAKIASGKVAISGTKKA
jgi:lipoate-protein ligase A